MPSIQKPNESTVLPFFKNGVTLDWYTVDLQTAGAALLQTATYSTVNGGEITGNVERSPVVVALEAIQAKTSIEVVGNSITGNAANSAFRVGIAALGGKYPTDDYVSFGNTEAFATYLRDLIRAQVNPNSNNNTFQSVDLSAATVTAFVI